MTYAGRARMMVPGAVPLGGIVDTGVGPVRASVPEYSISEMT